MGLYGSWNSVFQSLLNFEHTNLYEGSRAEYNF